ncbi:transmembrane protein [Perilla frutescens var. frutescens]|nr:transmembrane protein [Perilla frutescens var. frutescens]
MYEMHAPQHPFPCLHCHPRTYIRMVQNLIERCLLLRMDREQCVKALADRAGIMPLVTLTVWKELLKENKDFFHSYFRSIYPTIQGHTRVEFTFSKGATICKNKSTTASMMMNKPGESE